MTPDLLSPEGIRRHAPEVLGPEGLDAGAGEEMPAIRTTVICACVTEDGRIWPECPDCLGTGEMVCPF